MSKQSPVLFTSQGNRMIFNVTACWDAKDLQEYVELGGGCVDATDEEGPYTITLIKGNTDSSGAPWAQDAFCSEYILKCCLKNKVLPLQNFWIRKSTRFNEGFNPDVILNQTLTWQEALEKYSKSQSASKSSCLVTLDGQYPKLVLPKCDSSVTRQRNLAKTNGMSEDENSKGTKSEAVDDYFWSSKTKRGLKRNDFTDKDRRKMVAFIVENNGFGDFGSTKLWKAMKKHIPLHTWQSLKEHFKKRLHPAILNGTWPVSPNLQEKFKLGCGGKPSEGAVCSDLKHNRGYLQNERKTASAGGSRLSSSENESEAEQLCSVLPTQKRNEMAGGSKEYVCFPRQSFPKPTTLEDDEEMIELSSCSDAQSVRDQSDEDQLTNLEKQDVAWEWVEDNVPDALEQDTETGSQDEDEIYENLEEIDQSQINVDVEEILEEDPVESNQKESTNPNSTPNAKKVGQSMRTLRCKANAGNTPFPLSQVIVTQVAAENSSTSLDVIVPEKNATELNLPSWPKSFVADRFQFIEDEESSCGSGNVEAGSCLSDRVEKFVETVCQEEASTSLARKEVDKSLSLSNLRDDLPRPVGKLSQAFSPQLSSTQKSLSDCWPSRSTTRIQKNVCDNSVWQASESDETGPESDNEDGCPSPTRACLIQPGQERTSAQASETCTIQGSSQHDDESSSAESLNLVYSPTKDSGSVQNPEQTSKSTKDFCAQWDLGNPSVTEACIQTDPVDIAPIPVDARVSSKFGDTSKTSQVSSANSMDVVQPTPPLSCAVGRESEASPSLNGPARQTRSSAKRDRSLSVHPESHTFSSCDGNSSQEIIPPTSSSSDTEEIENLTASDLTPKTRKRKSAESEYVQRNKQRKGEVQIPSYSESDRYSKKGGCRDISPLLTTSSHLKRANSHDKSSVKAGEQTKKSPNVSSKPTLNFRRSSSSDSLKASLGSSYSEASCMYTRNAARQEKRQTRSNAK